MTPPYIPAADAGFRNWLVNFAALITAAPATFGLVAADAVTIQAQADAFDAAYTLATDPATRTAPTVAAKDAARRDAEAVVRPYAMQINANDAVTDQSRADLGLTIRKTVPTPIPAPASAPALALRALGVGTATLGYSDTAAPNGKAKPDGVTGVDIVTAAGVAPAVDPTAGNLYGIVTKSPFRVNFGAADNGKVCTVFARFRTRSGPAGVAQTGPWSAPLSFTINA